MKTTTKLTLLSVLALSIAACVQSRDPRNGVFNENVYLRKDFLIRSGADTTSTDPGWFLKATIIATSASPARPARAGTARLELML